MEINNLSFVFVGSLSKRKSPIDIIEAIKDLPEIDLTIIGDGEQKKIIEKTISNNKLINVKLLGTQNNSDILNLISDKDVFIMSSHYDGWGAVVNEALTCGLYIICSDKTGARDLLSNEKLGIIYKAGNIKNLKKCIQDCLSKAEYIKQSKKDREKWAESHINGKLIAEYFIDCLDGKGSTIPWK